MLARITSSRKTKRQPLRRTQRLGDRNKPRQNVRHLHAGELGAPAVADHHREVLAEVRDQRKRVTRVERERREHRADLAGEIRVEMLADRVGPRILVEQRDVFGRQQRTKLLPAGRHRLQHRQRLRAHRLQLLLRVVTVRRDVLDPLAEVFLRRRNPDHEELVEVRGGDRQELHAFEQRMRGVERLVQHPLVELEPAQLAVEVERRVLQIRGIEVGRRHHAQHRLRRGPRCGFPMGVSPPFSDGGVAGGIHKGAADFETGDHSRAV